jgi:tetratricopeptide (TPR) repeat protein
VSRTLALVPHGLQTAREHLARQDYPRARTLLRRVLRVDRRSGEGWYLLGLAWENDPFGSDETAHRCYRRAVRRDRRNALALAALGRNAMRLHKDTLSRKALHAAVSLAANDVNVVTIVVETHLERKDIEAAWKAVCRARFVLPNHRGIEALWNRVKFARTANRVAPPMPKRYDSRRVVPFLRLVDGETRFPRLRRDTASFTLPHFGS